MTRKPQPPKRKTPAKKKPGKAQVKAPAKGRAGAAAAKPAKPKAGKKTAPKPAPKARPVAPSLHWLVRPETIRKLWIWGGLALALLVAVELWVHMHGYFGLDGTFAFNAWYGFAACVAMVLGAKALGFLLKREDRYYGGD